MKKILAVDDSKTARSALKCCLEVCGYEILLAEDGPQALAILAEAGIDLMLTDLHMPGMNGIDLAHNARKVPGCRFMPIIILTAEKDEAVKKKYRSCTSFCWLDKPFKPEKVQAVVRTVI